ncbi:rhodanese-like domain-containing protein [Clostridium frigidicarnis]|uniref:Rhodanese-related sulfurtransferase n=1 Tax=Clostridium frigidicarnis TaxID=84698 RepID=A0A1I0ZZV2_9CLOT|nr:rhodanese-like domain-containing protein [Clostridium frigidicarnis]SFB31275.1 Rhodanese-related sulfurtransferase [Clostridium frigidicarnis]
MKKLLSLTAFIFLSLSVVFTGCSKEESKTSTSSTEQKEFKYYTAEETKKAIEEKKDIILLDIQVEDEFKAHHLNGVIPTYAYPVKSDEDKAKLEKVLPDLKKSTSPIIIVCPGGAGGAERTFAYLSEKGIDKDRLYILEKGQKGWPYEDLLEK